MSDTEWMVAAQAYLERLAQREYLAGKAAHARKGRKRRYLHAPSDYHVRLIECMNRNDEEGFKALKMLEGYASVLGF